MLRFFFAFFLLFSSLFLFAQQPKLVIPTGLKEISGIYDVKLSPDQQKLIAIAGRNIQVFDYSSGTLFQTLVAKGSVSKVSFSPDNRWAYVSGDKEFLVIDLKMIAIVKEFATTLGGISHRISPDGKSVCFGYTGLQRYDAPTGTITNLLTFPPEWGNLSNITFSPDGKQVLLHLNEYKSAIERSVILDPFTGKIIQELPIEKGTAFAAFTPKGNLLRIAYKDNPAEVYDISWVNPRTLQKTGKTCTITNAGTRALFSLDERLAFIGNTDDAWASMGPEQCVQFLSPDKPFRNIRVENITINNNFGVWKATRVRLNKGATKMIVGTDDNQIQELDLVGFSQIRTFGYRVFSPQKVAANAFFKGLVMVDNDDLLMCIFSQNGHISQRILGKNMSTAVFSPNGKWLAASTSSATMLWNTDLLKNPREIAGNADLALLKNGYGQPGSFSADNRLLAIHNSTNVAIVNTADGAPVKTILSKATQSFFAADGKTLYTYFKSPYGDTEPNYLQAWEIATLKKKWEIVFAEPIFKAILQPEAGKCKIHDIFKGNVLDINLATGTMTKTAENQPNLYGGAEISANGQMITDRGYVYQSATKSQLGSRSDAANGYVNTGYFYGKDQILVSPLQTNDIQFSNWQQGKEMGRLVMLLENDEWAFVMPDGRFDASPNMMQKLYYTKGTTVIPLEQLSEKYYTPRLFANVLENYQTPAVSGDDNINQLKQPPSIRIKYPDQQRNLSVEDDTRSYTTEKQALTLVLEATCPDDAVAEIRLFHNGKLVETATRNLIVEDDTPGAKQLSKSFNLLLNEGVNSFKAVALNSQRTESQPDDITVTWTPPAAPSPVPVKTGEGITLHILVVGINTYKNPKYNLNYALADAQSFQKSISNNCGRIVVDCKEHYLADQNAVKANITAELEKVAAEAGPKDVFVLYYAGHGVVSEEKHEFFLVPHDVTQLYGNDGALAQKGLSATELRDFSKKIKAQKQLFILDACQSSGALDVISQRGAAEEKAIAQLARSTGTHWLTAAGSEQFASEFAQLGHGVFTYCLLQGLAGAADSGDGKITVKELDAYLQEQVPELTQKYRGSPQYPSSYGFGQDFPVGVK